MLESDNDRLQSVTEHMTVMTMWLGRFCQRKEVKSVKSVSLVRLAPHHLNCQRPNPAEKFAQILDTEKCKISIKHCLWRSKTNVASLGTFPKPQIRNEPQIEDEYNVVEKNSLPKIGWKFQPETQDYQSSWKFPWGLLGRKGLLAPTGALIVIVCY